VTLLAGLPVGCATTVTLPADPHLLDLLRDGQSTEETVVLKLDLRTKKTWSKHLSQSTLEWDNPKPGVAVRSIDPPPLTNKPDYLLLA
jgi:hypothetical protein